MKKFKLLLAAFVATLFAFVGGNAFADGYSITIKNASANHTYEAYQVFGGDLAKTTEKDASAPRLSNIYWGTDVTAFTYDGESDAAKIAEKLSGQSYDSETAKAFAKEVSKHLAIAATSQTSTGDTVVLKVSKPGYYFVKDADASQKDQTDFAYTRFMMQVTGAEAVEVKNGVPSVQKKVKENSTGEWQAGADYDFDDDVPFQLTATLPSHFDDYSEYYLEFSDTLSAGLTYNKDAKVSLVNGNDKTDITSSFDGIDGDGSSFKINNLKSIPGVTASSKIVVEYTAKLNENAVIGSKGNPNTVKLVYSNNPNYEGKGEESPKGNTPEKNVKVFTYQTIINKVGEDEKTPLAGAEFTLVKKNKDGSTKNVDVVKNAEGTSFTFKGLDAGDYVLKETKTPDGYNTIEECRNGGKGIEFSIVSDVKEGALKSLKVTGTDREFTSDLSAGSLTAKIVNRKGSLLPSTGGMGTTILYVIGSILVLVAAVLLITKKRMDAAK
ncbi:isopeptide-forming domain-containing fimbrial protein [Streptococcus equinus]|uniref:isopeptide-forming domain-containing fimbrial protein n=1 Tax=Streptococcus equinus TaxID=1335 RepID=UPI00088BB134|nr:isopeptide-forming domain-containing fimbrial protein [Streptococcus equinus]SDQ37286.1 LPXTG-motif cell wall anchor domain-containing protein/fimbrial isopeptide formation D2 domain-containing protein [Streptococcus equinus]SEN76898.1 LPXTG-motif cell wall anchor domain-containing protein/fimbrial isopeptide formation D2 domain-containing protein [Streptococcus equinus]